MSDGKQRDSPRLERRSKGKSCRGSIFFFSFTVIALAPVFPSSYDYFFCFSLSISWPSPFVPVLHPSPPPPPPSLSYPAIAFLPRIIFWFSPPLWWHFSVPALSRSLVSAFLSVPFAPCANQSQPFRISVHHGVAGEAQTREAGAPPPCLSQR